VRHRSVIIPAPGSIEIQQTSLPDVGPEHVGIHTLVSGISPGTELLAYRGELPEADPDDAELDPHAGGGGYPMSTGYCSVGVVTSVGDRVDPSWRGRRVFGFLPHGTGAVVDPDSLIPLPDSLPEDLATFIPNLETAIGLVMDARPVLGERVVVIGQGIVGLLVTRLLARYPLGLLATLDRIPGRRARSTASGAELALDPASATDRASLREALETDQPGADLVIELSGNPAALNDAIQFAGYGGRIVAGSWYGSKSAPIDLGGRFHRNRISLISSQVSTVAPDLSARWTKSRRMATVLRLLPELGLDSLITHRFPLDDAADAFALLDTRSDETIQVVLTCSDQETRKQDV
jgi:2-desacetyl-2-hydroxyethyl bacteriochlorophyllide A dehydrogenase